jgi:phospholipase/carboxylesterase
VFLRGDPVLVQNGAVGLHFISRSAADPIATLVLLHGLGADERDLMGLAPYFDARLEIVCPRAPMTSDWGGYSWFNIQQDPGGLAVDGEQARANLGLLIEFLRDVPGPILLGGFSQGAMMSVGVLLERGELVEGVIQMSGGWLPCFEPADFSPKPVFASHGTQDPTVHFEIGRDSALALEELGCPVEFHAYQMAHEISEGCLQDVVRWVDDWLQKEANRP